MKKALITALIIAVPAFGLFLAWLVHDTKKIQARLDALPAPGPAPDSTLGPWLAYVEKYPNLEDDLKIKRALDTLDAYDYPTQK